MYIISYLLVLVLSLTMNEQTLSATVDKGQNISLQCAILFGNQQVFAPFTYSWHDVEDTLTILVNTATYIITAYSDVAYQCRAFGSDSKGRPRFRARGTIDITVRSTYLL